MTRKYRRFKTYDLNLLKQRLPEYLRAIGCELKPKGETGFTAACPIHNGTKQNFHIDEQQDGTWLWHCFSGCGGDGGSVIDLHAKLNDLRPRDGECVKGVAEVLGIEPDKTAKLPVLSSKEKRERELKRERKRQAEERAKRDDEKVAAVLQKSLLERIVPLIESDWRSRLENLSPIKVKGRQVDSGLLVRYLFNPDDVLWMGEPHESGRTCHKDNFRTLTDWLKVPTLPPRIAAGTFKEGVVSRRTVNVKDAPFIVIESDNLIGKEPETDEEKERNKELSYGLFFFLQHVAQLTPRAVIDTGNKSLHMWFDRPIDIGVQLLLDFAEGFRIDKGLLDGCQAAPLRLPGTVHEKSNQPALLHYLNPIR